MITFMRGNHTFKSFPTIEDLVTWNKSRTVDEVHGFEMFSLSRGGDVPNVHCGMTETYPEFVTRCVSIAVKYFSGEQEKDSERKSAKSIDPSILDLCQSWAGNRSKDPRSQVGAAVYDPVTGGVFLGYNGFPKGIPDLNSRWQKRDKEDINGKQVYVVHAERNALRKAAMAIGENVARCTLYCTHKPCGSCMLDIVSHGIKRVVYANQHWNDPVTDMLSKEAGVVLDWIAVDK